MMVSLHHLMQLLVSNAVGAVCALEELFLLCASARIMLRLML